MKSEVLNDSMGSPFVFGYPTLTRQQEISLLSELFEQLLIFDKVTLSVSRQNFALAFLIQKLGINTVERLIENGYINFLLWTPLIFTSPGMEREDGTMDESVIYGRPPIVAGELGPQDLDPERNIKSALSHFGLRKDKIRNITKKALKEFVIPDGMGFSTDSANFVIDAYKKNNLATLNLPYGKEPDQMNVHERGLLLELSNKVIQAAISSKYGLKSYENYEPYAITKLNIENIGKAYHVAGNTAEIFRIENLPNLKELFIADKLDFDSVFKIRHLSTAKYYRKWINEVGENSDAQEVTKEYINEIKGSNKFIEKPGGKLVKTLSSFTVSKAIGAVLGGSVGAVIAGPVGAAIASPIGAAVADLSLSLLESMWVDSILKGKNPSMFIDDIRREINEKKE